MKTNFVLYAVNLNFKTLKVEKMTTEPDILKVLQTKIFIFAMFYSNI